jgi:hypothetical protein
MHVTAIGHIARQVLRRNPFAVISGTSSQGIYLQPLGDLTLYLTPQPFRGPLTINVRKHWDSILSNQPGNIVSLAGDEITFNDPLFTIEIESPLIWKPCQPPRQINDCSSGYAKVTQQVQTIHPDHPYLTLLDFVAGGKPIQIEFIDELEDQLIQLSQTLKTGNPSEIVPAMISILGIGPGLTPLSDDLLLGILLTTSRTGKYATWSEDVIRFYHSILSAAEEKTTSVSWSILSCAVQGSADERIIRVLDGLIAGREIPDHDLENLLSWGSSSGMAVLAGMMMALA